MSPCDDPRPMAVGSWQTLWHRHPGERSGDQLTLGRARRRSNEEHDGVLAIRVRVLWHHDHMGGGQLRVLRGGAHGKHGFDPYPYIRLNLFLSMLAGVQAAALLVAAKRADGISSEIAVHTEKNTEGLKGLVAENTTLTQQVNKNTDLFEQIHSHVSALSPDTGRFPPPTQTPTKPRSTVWREYAQLTIRGKCPLSKDD
jgi:hypothetical protein